MIDPMALRPVSSHPSQPESSSPGTAIAVGLGVISIVLSPPVVSLAVQLRWQIGGVAPALWAISGTVLAAAVGTAIERRRLSGWIRSRPAIGRRVALRVIVLGLSLSLTVVLAEVLLRALYLPFDPLWTPSEFPLCRFDEDLGWSYVPGRATTQLFRSPDGGTRPRRIPLVFDPDLGARVSKSEDRIDPHAPTILFVGGSFTFGHGVTWSESFVGRIGAMRPDLQVVNLGVQGFGTDQSLLRLERDSTWFSDIRMVVYCFIPRHVLRNAVADRRTLIPMARMVGTKPRFELSSDGHLALVNHPEQIEDRGPSSSLLSALRIAWMRYGPIPDPALTRALIHRMGRVTTALDAEFVVVRWIVESDLRDTVAMSDLQDHSLGVYALDANTGAPPDFVSWVIPGDGHPTPRAHDHVARLLAQRLSNQTTSGPRPAPRPN